MHPDIPNYNRLFEPHLAAVCDLLANVIDASLPHARSQIWHRHPVWFLNDNPTVGYSKQKAGIRLMFWSGADFEEPALNVLGGKFKDASIFYNNAEEIAALDLRRWLAKSMQIQWNYRDIVRKKGLLEKFPA
jgi:hypothetical protein